MSVLRHISWGGGDISLGGRLWSYLLDGRQGGGGKPKVWSIQYYFALFSKAAQLKNTGARNLGLESFSILVKTSVTKSLDGWQHTRKVVAQLYLRIEYVHLFGETCYLFWHMATVTISHVLPNISCVAMTMCQTSFHRTLSITGRQVPVHADCTIYNSSTGEESVNETHRTTCTLTGVVIQFVLFGLQWWITAVYKISFSFSELSHRNVIVSFSCLHCMPHSYFATLNVRNRVQRRWEGQVKTKSCNLFTEQILKKKKKRGKCCTQDSCFFAKKSNLWALQAN